MTYFKFRPGSSAEISLEDAITGTGQALPFNDCRQVNWLVIGAGTISMGTVVIESAHRPDYAGRWKELDRIDATTLTGDGLDGNTFPMPPGGFVRGRIEDDIEGGGMVTVRLNGLFG